MSNVEMFGLMPKAQVVVSGDHVPMLNFKLKVDADFYREWTETMARLSGHFAGGGNAIILKAARELLPKLKEAAAEFPPKAPGKRAKKGGSI